MIGDFVLSARSLKNLIGVHPELVKVVKKALEYSAVDFTVIEGVRTLERQKQMVAQGKSKTLNSRHLTGHAVDLVPIVGGAVLWNQCPDVAKAMKEAAKELNIPVEWGGDWKGFSDQPHFQLPWKDYP